MNVKSGLKTSEFWGKTLIQIATAWNLFHPFVPIPPTVSVLVTAGLEGLYLVSRAYVKAKRGVDLPAFPQ